VFVGLVVVVVLGAGVAALIISSASSSLTADSQALAKVGLPLGGGKITSVVAVTGPRARTTRVPVELRGDRIWPRGTIRAGERVTIDVVVKRPGWISWLAGSRERLHLTLVAPSAQVRQTYVTVGSGAPLRLHFTRPVAAVWYGPSAEQMTRHAVTPASDEVTLARTAEAGSVWVAGVPRGWETTRSTVVSWFPAGAAAAAVANPASGGQIKPNTPISLTFSKPVSSALNGAMPPVSPVTSGTWHQVNTHTIVFRPEGYGYGLGAHVTIGLPAGVKLIGGQANGTADDGSWTVPPGSAVRLQQVLATLGYLPLRFNSHSTVASTPQAQVNAAIDPPSGNFSWRYGNEPSALRSMWQPGTSGVMTRGAVMAFENDHGITPDGAAGPTVWKALMAAAVAGHRSSFGYTFVSVSEGSPESIDVWHNGNSVVTGPVNTGIPSAPTAQGTFPVFSHSPSVTMSGTNPDGSHYSDPGVPWVSYFNGGDALHGFLRASYGTAQSLGCVEMPYAQAAKVYPYTPVGTLVHVA
jgi:peptidoglycan hydrolase-like protein with peptidoglycan-binding domain